MVDLETMGNKSNAPIVAIGVVSFDHKKVHQNFYQIVDLQSSIDAGGVVDGSTVMWWLDQSEAARRELLKESVSLHKALDELSGWVRLQNAGTKEEGFLWGNGAAFDNVILRNAYDSFPDLNIPWEFWQDRCYRTIKALNTDIKAERVGTHHNALDDARTQAEHLIQLHKAGRCNL